MPAHTARHPTRAGRRRRGPGFAGRAALITGGASGIGRALAVALTARGARVTIADLDGDAAGRAAAEIGTRLGSHLVTARQLDVRDREAFRSLVGGLGDLDLLCNNAGIPMGGPTHELDGAHWDRVIDVNLRGVVNGVLAAYPAMVARGRGHIVNTASGAGLVAAPFVAPYTATKHAVVGLSLALRPEAALHGVVVSVLCPGAVETPIHDRRPDRDLPAVARLATSREYLAAVHQRPVAAAGFAERALDRIERGRGIIVLPAATRAPWYLHRLSPWLMEQVLRVLAREVDQTLVRRVS